MRLMVTDGTPLYGVADSVLLTQSAPRPEEPAARPRLA